MFSLPAPAVSPLAHRGTTSRYPAQMFHPSQSSPLAHSSPAATQARRRRAYKSQGPSRFPAAALQGMLEDTPQKQFLRSRFEARCLARAEGRARAVRSARSADGSGSDGFGAEDDDSSTVDDDDDDYLDDELYRRVMMNDERRARHSKRVSFERDFGSSIDPSMHDDMDALEWELTGKASKYNAPSPPSEFLDDDMIQEYLAELEDIQQDKEPQQNTDHAETGTIDLDREDPGDLEREFTRGSDPQQPSPTRSMYSDSHMSSPPSSPSRPSAAAVSWNCPFCSARIQRTHIACAACAAQCPLEHADASWRDSGAHPGRDQTNHVPLATTAPSIGVIMLCGAPGCDWCFAL